MESEKIVEYRKTVKDCDSIMTHARARNIVFSVARLLNARELVKRNIYL